MWSLLVCLMMYTMVYPTDHPMHSIFGKNGTITTTQVLIYFICPYMLVPALLLLMPRSPTLISQLGECTFMCLLVHAVLIVSHHGFHRNENFYYVWHALGGGTGFDSAASAFHCSTRSASTSSSTYRFGSPSPSDSSKASHLE